MTTETTSQPTLAQFAAALSRYDYFHSYSDDSRVCIAGERAYKELIRMARQLPRADALVLYEKKCNEEYGPKEWWSRIYTTDPIPSAVASFVNDLDNENIR